MAKESFYDLQQRKNAFNSFFDNDKEYDFELVYAIRKNLKKIKNEQELIQETIPENAEGMEDFEQERIDLLVKNGAEKKQLSNGNVQVKPTDEFDEEGYGKDLEELKEKYKELLDKQEEISKKQDKILSKKGVEVDYYNIHKDSFPEKIKFSELPEAIIDLIVMD